MATYFTYFLAMLIAAIIVILKDFSKTFTCRKCKKNDLLKCDVKWNKDIKGYLCKNCRKTIKKMKGLIDEYNWNEETWDTRRKP